MFMKKRDIIATILLSLGAVLITVALLIVFLYYPSYGRANPVDDNIAAFFVPLDTGIAHTIMVVISYLGQSIVYIAILVILYYVWDKKKAYKTIFTLVSSTAVNAITKISFHLERPAYVEVDEYSYGLPSGHAQMSTTFWGTLSVLIPKWGMLTAGIALPLLIGFSRIFLIAHWFTDVLMGLGLGLIIVGLFIFVNEPVTNFYAQRSIAIKIISILLIFAIFAIPIILLHDRAVPDEFRTEISVLKALVLFTTGSIAYILEGKLVDYNSRTDKWWKIIVRILIAAIPLAIIYLYDEILTNGLPLEALKISLDMVVYGIMGPILFLFLPWVIKKLNL
jgi:membrane-associated phospholipid phosphatase